jgi:hypothetical protein
MPKAMAPGPAADAGCRIQAPPLTAAGVCRRRRRPMSRMSFPIAGGEKESKPKDSMVRQIRETVGFWMSVRC